jgi:uncharacterized Zn finger protein (UPF0148 family)
MTDPAIRKCPNCGAPLDAVIGDVEDICEYCGSLIRLIPEAEELEVVRTREDMKRRERVAIQKEKLRRHAEQQEMERWRRAAATVALRAMPIIGDAAGRAVFRGAMGRGGCGCAGCVVFVAMALGGTVSAATLLLP